MVRFELFAMKLRQGYPVAGTDAGAVSASQKAPRKAGSHRAKRSQGSSGRGGAADTSFLAFWFQAVRDAEGSYCCKPEAKVTHGSATGPYKSSPTCHTYYGLLKAVWGAEARDLCGWAPGTKVKLQVLRACCPYRPTTTDHRPQPSQKREVLPREG